MKDIKVKFGTDKYRVKAVAKRSGKDWCVIVTGGTQPHVGAVSLAEYEPERRSATVSTVTAYTHRDDAVSARFAKAIASATKSNVCVSAGIHVDDAGTEELETLQNNCEALLKKLLDAIG